MQASRIWREPGGTLGTLVQEAHQRADQLSSQRGSLTARAREAVVAQSFGTALQRRDGAVGLIAEVKRRSPSKGWIGQSIVASHQAKAYERGGAAAISVLTESNHFGGSTADLVDVIGAVALPVLKKDFHVQPLQLIEARALGASAALVIVRAVGPSMLPRLMETAADLQLELLIEVHNEEELEIALECRASIIGVNNRDLETLQIDTATCERVIARVPRDLVAVAESGVSSRQQVEHMAAGGADAVLVGSAISAAQNPEAAVRGLVGIPAVRRDA